MSHFDAARNLLHTRIVYWGPQGSGKTATLASLRGFLDPEGKTRVYSVAAPDGSTLTFDLLPVEEFRFGSTRVRLRILAAPGLETRGHARLALLKRADAVVFVADARRSAMEVDLASWQELQGTLRTLGRDPAAVPTVWAFNQRDLPESASAGELATLLNVEQLPAYETVAPEGHGVRECFREVFRLLLTTLAQRHDLADADLESALPSRLLPQLKRGAVPSPLRAADERRLLIEAEGADISAAEQAIQAQINLVQAHVEADAANRRLEARNRELVAVNRVARSILSAMETDNLLVVLLDATANYLDVTHATCVLFDPTDAGELRTHVRGFGRDPALGLKDEAARRFFELLRNSDGPVPFMDEYNPDLLKAVKGVDRRVRRAMYQPIKGDHDKPEGWIGIYHTGAEPRLTTQGLLFLSAVSRLAALGLGKIALLEKMHRGRARLESALRHRTGELEMANAKVRALNRGLESRVTERLSALEESNRKLKAGKAGAVHAARLHGMEEVASLFVSETAQPVAELSSQLAAVREGLDDVRARVAAVSPDSDGMAAIDELEALLERSEHGARRVSGFVRSLARVAAGDAGPGQSVGLNTLVADAAALLEGRIEASAELELSLGTLPDLEGEGGEIGHVVLGLLTNAVEAVEKRGGRGHVQVTTFARGDKITLIVRDDGCGIEEGLLKRVFEPFSSTKSDEPGAGLGLHAAYKSVKARGGDIRLRSKPGDGTTVTVTLPVARSPARIVATDPAR